jgi:hypothetical protein
VGAIIDAALPTCAYRFEHRDGAWKVEPTSEVPQQYVEPPDDAVLDFLVDRLSPALAVLKTIYGIDEAPPPDSDEAVAAPKRRTRKPSITTLIKRAEKTGKAVTSITTPDGTTIHFGEPEASEANNPWLADIAKATKQ